MATHQFKVPATSANLGPGFDSIGIALQKFLFIEAYESDAWQVVFNDEYLNVLPSDESNLVIRTAIATAEKYGAVMPTVKIHMGSEIPLTHGMGSSASAIIAGIELADRFCGLELSDFEKVFRGSEIEGHPDNVGPCVTGGLFVGYFKDDELFYNTLDLEGFEIIMTVPEYEIDTKEARRVLPEVYEKQDAVDQNAINNALLMAMFSKDFKSMGHLMMKDLLHEPYRRQLIMEYDAVREIALENGAYATVISGAGPSLMTLCDAGNAEKVLAALKSVDSCHHERIKLYKQK